MVDVVRRSPPRGRWPAPVRLVGTATVVIAALACRLPVRPQAPLGTAGMVSSQVRLMGRFVADPAHPETRLFAWGNSGVEVRFRGPPPVFILGKSDLRQAVQYFALTLDDGAPWRCTLVGEHAELGVPSHHGRGDGRPHRLRLVRLSEASVGEARLLGIRVPPATTLLPAIRPPRPHLVVVGDSISAGYGNLSPDAHQPFSPRDEDASQAFGPLAAGLLGGETTVLAFSGKGAARNRDGSQVDTMAELWRRALPDSAWSHGTADEDPGSVDAAVVNLGTNDLAARGFEAASLGDGIGGILRALRRAYPHAHLVACIGPMLQDAPPRADELTVAREQIGRAVEEFCRQVDNNISALEFPAQTAADGYGSDYHPSLATHRAMAERLAEHLRGRLPTGALPDPR